MRTLSQEELDFVDQTVSSKGWSIIEEMLLDEFISNPLDIDTDGKTNDEVAREVAALEKAGKSAKEFLDRVHRLSNKGDELNLRNGNYK
jgi:hypothetical protein